MATRETPLQQRIQRAIEKRGGYVKKNHGNMTTVKGIADLNFCYCGIAVYLEVKAPDSKTNVSEAQGIHCRKVIKAGGISAIVHDVATVNLILDVIDEYHEKHMPIRTWIQLYQYRGGGRWDTGEQY